MKRLFSNQLQSKFNRKGNGEKISLENLVNIWSVLRGIVLIVFTKLISVLKRYSSTFLCHARIFVSIIQVPLVFLQNKCNFFGLFHFLKSGPCQRHGSFLIIKGSIQKFPEICRNFQKFPEEASGRIQKYPETFRSIQTHPEASRSIEKKHLEFSRTGSHRFILLYIRQIIQSVYGSQSVSIIKTVYRSEFYQSVLSKNIDTRSDFSSEVIGYLFLLFL
nr:uncharacterized protein LOC124814402 [Hydra vulgaris]